MSTGNPSLQDGSAGDPNASSQSQILLHIKELLAETRLCLDALDQSTLAGLRSDEEYKHAVGYLLSLLTTIPLSDVVNKALTSAMETLTAQLSSLLPSLDVGVEHDTKDAVGPSTTAGPLPPNISRKKRNPTSTRSQTIVAQSPQQESEALTSQALQAGFGLGSAGGQPSMVPHLDQETMERALEEIKRDRRMMATIYFIKGGKKDNVTIPHLVEEMNKAPSAMATGTVSCAWETVRGDIVIAFCGRSTPFIDDRKSETMMAEFSHLWTPDFSAFLRQGGDSPRDVVELEVVRGGDNQFNWPTVLKGIQQELEKLSSSSTHIVLYDLHVATWSKRWMACWIYWGDLQRLLEKEWPRSYKAMIRHARTDVEIEIRMNLFCIEDMFDFRV